MKIFVLFMLLCAVLPASAESSEPCGDVVDRRLFASKTWMALADWYHEYPHCVDGYMAEYVVSKIGDWLAQERPAFLRLQAAVARHAEFELLVNWHLQGEYHSTEKLRSIANNAERKCPSRAANVCANIRRTVETNLAGNRVTAHPAPPGG